jgi:hypothetical protein
MDTILQENFNHHTTVAKALSHDVQSEAFYGTIRVYFIRIFVLFITYVFSICPYLLSGV